MDYARFVGDEFDADLVYGPPRGEGLVTVPLCTETVTPLCDPERAARIRTPDDLLDQVLIQSDNKQVRWPLWFARNGLPAPRPWASASTAASSPSRPPPTGSGWRSNRPCSPSARSPAAASSRRCGASRRTSPMSATTSSTRRPRGGARPLRVFAHWLAQEMNLVLPEDLT